ncbi:helix-turn-helix transcriptional regulator [Fannyhessea vaginae]|uniref:helix-turn-helix domain-containing protein n=1 Tax=Fannyhessea vaginae TaxID=82135 RepID=UPI003369E7DA
MLYQDAIKDALKRKNMSASELAQKIGTSRGYVSQMLSGKVKDPSFKRTLAICRVLGLSIQSLAELIEDEKDKR